MKNASYLTLTFLLFSATLVSCASPGTPVIVTATPAPSPIPPQAGADDELPAQAVKYVRHVEELIGVPIALLSTSPKREDTILVRDPFED